MARKEVLRTTREYEDYDENVAMLSIGDLRDLGLIKCGGCSGGGCSGGGCSGGGCSGGGCSGGGCCKS